MVIIFAICLSASIFWSVKDYRKAGAPMTDPTSPAYPLPMSPMKQEETSMSSNNHASTYTPTEISYNSQLPGQGGYTQPPMPQQVSPLQQSAQPTQQQSPPLSPGLPFQQHSGYSQQQFGEYNSQQQPERYTGSPGPQGQVPTQQYGEYSQQQYPERYDGPPRSSGHGAAQSYYSGQPAVGNTREGVAEMHSPGLPDSGMQSVSPR
ncbi:MAG: hypothetical protein Q9164_006272 [Protoblastenia rupestris]